MALAPTLLTIKNVAVGVGLATLAGLAVTAETGQRGPTTGAVSVAGLAPTISVQLGPTTDPDVGGVDLVGQIPFLQRILYITTGLPDGTPESNDLTPTLVWQETTQPTKATLTMGGLAPAVVGNTGQSIAISVGSAILQGLAPTVSVPSGQDGVSAPDKAEMVMVELAPTLLLELAVSPEQSAFTITGLVPDLFFQVGWTDVPLSTGTWNDVPRV